MAESADITVACDKGELDLNVWESIILYSLYESTSLLAKGVDKFTTKCLSGMEANKEVCSRNAYQSLALATALVRLFDYQTAEDVVKEADASGEAIADVAVRKGLMTEEEAAVQLHPLNMTQLIK